MKKQKYWFKAKKTGLGWYPASWEGWLVTLGYIALLGISAVEIDSYSGSLYQTMIELVPATVILTGILIWICYRRGEPPRAY